MATERLLDNVDVDTVGDAYDGLGGSKTVTIHATDFGGGSVTLEISDDGNAGWVPVTQNGTAVSFVENSSAFLRKLSQGQQIRATLAGSTGASAVTVTISD